MSGSLSLEIKRKLELKRQMRALRDDTENREASLDLLYYLRNKEQIDGENERERREKRQNMLAKKAILRRQDWMIGNKSNPVLADCKWIYDHNIDSIFVGHCKCARSLEVAIQTNRKISEEFAWLKLSKHVYISSKPIREG